MNALKYMPGLDGIRACAVFMVMLFHFGYMPSGWIGVQLFFVLSGYLITAILLRSGSASVSEKLRQFYWRRAIRILPVMLILVLVSGGCYLAFGVPETFISDAPWILAFVANFRRLMPSDLGSHFVHMWSLAVEEQFYLLWPLAVFLLPARHLGKLILWMLLLCPVVRYLVFQYLEDMDFGPARAGMGVYVLPFTQFDAFATGAALALWPTEIVKNLNRRLVVVLSLVAIAGVCSLLWSHYLGTGAYFGSLGYPMYLLPAYGYVWGYSLLNVLCLAVIAAAIQSKPWVMVLSSPIPRRIGQVSYGLYVYHLPLLIAGSHVVGPDAPGVWRFGWFLLWTAVALLVAEASFRWVEAPLLKFKEVKWGASGPGEARAGRGLAD